MLFRSHRGTIEESMETAIEVETLEDIAKLLNLEQFGIETNLVANHYCMDERIDWDTYIITNRNYGVVGFTNGDIK